jgi:hypothetical protein
MLREQGVVMADEFSDVGGIIVPSNSLEVRRARDFAAAAASGRLDYVTFVESRKHPGDGGETIVIDVEPERPQRAVHDIRRIERIAVRFKVEDNWYPEVLALRNAIMINRGRKLLFAGLRRRVSNGSVSGWAKRLRGRCIRPISHSNR